MAYTAHGAVAAARLGNGRWEHTDFNSRLQPTVIGLGATSTDSSLLRLDYSYGTTTNNGNVLSQRIVVSGAGLDVTQSYTYDELNRLKTASEVGWSQTYDYDRYGNRAVRLGSFVPNSALTPQSASATDLSAFDQSNNRLRQATFPNVLYDVAGNLTRDHVGSTFTYDGENRQITSSVGGVPASYFYDGDGHRVKKVVGPVGSAVTTVFVYNAGGQLVAEYTNSTSPPSGVGGTSYLTSDHLGSSRVVTKADGTVKARYDYLPFGEELPTDKRPAGIGYGGSDGTKQKFTQKERDSESGLDYFLARYYSSAQGRFTSPDEFTGGPHEIFEFAEDASSNPTFYADVTNPQSLNKYQYCYNNPLQYTDPDGHKVIIPKKRLPGGSKGAALIATAQEMSATGNPIAAAAAVTLIVVGVGISVYGLLSIPAQPTATTPATTPSQAEPEAQPQPMPPPPPITKNWDRHSNRRPGKPERGDASRRPGRNPPGPSRGPNKWKGPWPPKPPPPKPPDPPPPRLPETPKPPALVALGDLQGLRRVGSAEV